MISIRKTIVLLLAISLGTNLGTDDLPNSKQAETENAEEPKGIFNLPSKTLGGMQFWTDLVHCQQWRIQQHCRTGHCRVLSPGDIRHAWGNFSHCEQKLAEIKKEKSLASVKGKVVILVHGLGRTRSSMDLIEEFLRENSKLHVINVGYASTRKSVEDHATALKHVIDNLPDVEEINFVCHSLGNLVVRNYLFKITDEKTGELTEKRIKRMVMLGPPNNGAQLAKRFENMALFQLALGESATQLATDWDELSKKLATPKIEFGIIAGSGGGNPLIDGDDDMFVAVDETRLAGACDFTTVQCSHTMLMPNSEVKTKLTRFLLHGHFVSRDKMKPIEK